MKYDGERIIESMYTNQLFRALEEVMKANCAMMRKHDPEFADCWTWGKCEIDDLANTKGFSFVYGGNEDKPKWMVGINFVVVSKTD